MGPQRPIDQCLRPVLTFCCLLALATPAVLVAHPGADAALAYFNQQIREQPAQQLLYIQRGVIYSNDGQYQKALEDFRQAARLGERILVSFDLGVLHYRMGEFAAARHYFDEFLQRFPNHAACLEYRARLLRDAGDYGGAVADFRRLFELRERPNPGDFSSVASMLASAGDDAVEQALAILDQGNSMLGLTPQLQQQAIELELRRGRPDHAIDRLRRLEPLLGESPEWKVDLADLHLAYGDSEYAGRLLAEASRQLAAIRRTPARDELRERIALLQQHCF